MMQIKQTPSFNEWFSLPEPGWAAVKAPSFYYELEGVVVQPFPVALVEHGSTHCQLPSALGFQTKIIRQQEIYHLTS